MTKRAWTFGPALAWLLASAIALGISAWFTKPWPVWYVAVYALFVLVGSGIAFVAYWLDKKAAEASRRRIPENTLHLMALLGGWPGAVIAQQLLRHKSSKGSFRVALASIVIAHLLLSGLLGYVFFSSLK